MGVAGAERRDGVEPVHQLLAAHQEEEERDDHEHAVERERPGGGQNAADRRGGAGLRLDLAHDVAEVARDARDRVVDHVAGGVRKQTDQLGDVLAAHGGGDEADRVAAVADHVGRDRGHGPDQDHDHADREQAGGQTAPAAQAPGQPLLQRPQDAGQDRGQKQLARDGEDDHAEEQCGCDDQDQEEAGDGLLACHGPVVADGGAPVAPSWRAHRLAISRQRRARSGRDRRS